MSCVEKLFAYGTLLEPEIQKQVFKKELRGVAGCLKGYEKFSVHIDSIQYSSIKASPSSVVRGVVFEITEDDLNRADAYEGSEYERMKVLLENGECAWVYLT